MSRTQCCEGDEVNLDRPVLLRPALIVSEVDLPLSFSSRLTLVAAADSPMKRAKIGSATLLMIYVGAGIVGNVVVLVIDWACF